MMPVLDRMHPELAPRLNAGLGAMGRLRDTAVSHHDDVLSRIHANGAVLKDLRNAVAPLQPYMTSV